jgi:hypothetical protein
MNTIYHVAPTDHTGDLLSLYAQHGDAAYDLFSERWPDAGGLCHYHPHYVHCYDTLAEAMEHVEAWGGKVYAIQCAEVDVERDSLEFDHPMVRDVVPAAALIEIAAQ